MPQYLLGVDVGSTKTQALISDAQANLLGVGRGGAGNHEGVGYDGLRKTLQESTAGALEMSGLSIAQISGAGFGVAGYDWPSERDLTLEAIATLGLECPFDAVNDVDIGLIAGASQGWGIVVDAGTGNNVRGRTCAGKVAGITGNGGMFGEYGGASELVHQALIAISYEWSQRGPRTSLTPAFMGYVGAMGITDFLEGLVLGRYALDAEMAPLVFQAAENGDSVAQELIIWNSRELGRSAVGIIRQLDFTNCEFEVVMIGSMFNGGRLAVEPMQQVILEEAPGARFVRLSCPPAVGGLLLGMETIGLETRPVHARLVENTRAFLNKIETQRFSLP